MQYRQERITSADELQIGGLYVCQNHSDDVAPFDGAVFKVLSAPFWGLNHFGQAVLHVIVETIDYDGPHGVHVSAEGLMVWRLNEQFGTNIISQAFPLDRLGLKPGLRNTTCHRLWGIVK